MGVEVNSDMRERWNGEGSKNDYAIYQNRLCYLPKQRVTSI